VDFNAFHGEHKECQVEHGTSRLYGSAAIRLRLQSSKSDRWQMGGSGRKGGRRGSSKRWRRQELDANELERTDKLREHSLHNQGNELRGSGGCVQGKDSPTAGCRHEPSEEGTRPSHLFDASRTLRLQFGLATTSTLNENVEKTGVGDRLFDNAICRQTRKEPLDLNPAARRALVLSSNRDQRQSTRYSETVFIPMSTCSCS